MVDGLENGDSMKRYLMLSRFPSPSVSVSVSVLFFCFCFVLFFFLRLRQKKKKRVGELEAPPYFTSFIIFTFILFLYIPIISFVQKTKIQPISLTTCLMNYGCHSSFSSSSTSFNHTQIQSFSSKTLWYV